MRFDGEQMRLVTLLKRTVTTNSQNEDIEAWNADISNSMTDAAGNMYVKWWDQGGTETLEGGQVVAVQDVRCKMRFFDGLNAKDYAIRKDGQVFDILSFKEINRREGWMVMLEGRDNAA